MLLAAWTGLLSAAGPKAEGSAAEWPVSLVDVAAQAGLVYPSIYGGVERKRFIIETNGAGVAFLDYDNDGWLDALVLSGTRLEEGGREEQRFPAGQAPSNRLYRGNGDGTFRDVTERVGLVRRGWASAVCAGDYDNDGWLDLFVTYYGHDVLYRNRGGERFEDVTEAAGLASPGTRWGSGCSFVDYDRDGRLDLFVAHYLVLDLPSAREPGQGANCLWKGIPVNCGPKGLPTDTNRLLHNEGGGRFRDVSEASGVAKVTERYPMTAAAADFDGDGWVDIYVACDSSAAILYHNNADGTFTDVAVRSGSAYNDLGNAQAGMGLAVNDFNRDGLLDLLKTHFADDVPALYRNLGRGLFEDVAVAAGLGVENRHVEWGAGLPDLDNDGWPDVFYVTGNVYPEIERMMPLYPHRGPRIVFRNLGRRTVLPGHGGVGPRSGPAPLEPGHRLRGLRQRRRPRRAGDEHERAAVAAPQRLFGPERVARGPAGGPPLQPMRPRRDRDRLLGWLAAGAGGAQPVELLLPRRPASPLRPGPSEKADAIEVRWPSGEVDVLRGRRRTARGHDRGGVRPALRRDPNSWIVATKHWSV